MSKSLPTPVLPELIRDALFMGTLPSSIRPIVDLWWKRLSKPIPGRTHTHSFPHVRKLWPYIDAMAAENPDLVREGVIATIRSHQPALFEVSDAGYLEGVLAVSGGDGVHLCALIGVEDYEVPGRCPRLVVDPVGVVLIGDGSGGCSEIEWSADGRHRNLKRPPSLERRLALTRVIGPIVLGHGTGAGRHGMNHIPAIGRA